MTPAGFEPATPTSERLQTHVSDRAATGLVLRLGHDCELPGPFHLGNSLINLQLDPVFSVLKALSNNHKMSSSVRSVGRRGADFEAAVPCVVLQATRD